MTMKRSLAVLACSLFTHAAQADVMYSWQQTQGSPTMRKDFYLDLVFSDAAVAAGRLNLAIINGPVFPCQPEGVFTCHEPEPRLLSMHFGYIDSNGRKGRALYYEAGVFPIGLNRLDLSVTFLPGGFLSGGISAVMAVGPYFTLGSDGTLFTVRQMGTESGYCDNWLPTCYGAQGVIRQVPAGQVPEPASWVVFGAGALAAWSARRARRRPHTGAVQRAGASAA